MMNVMGKTFIAILLSLHNQVPPADATPPRFAGTIFIVPSHLQPHWTSEIRKFAPDAHLATSVTPLTLISADLLLLTPQEACLCGELSALRIVYDESHALSETLIAHNLSACYLWTMTATPTTHANVAELFQMQFAAMGLGSPNPTCAGVSNEITVDRFNRLVISGDRDCTKHLLPEVHSVTERVRRTKEDIAALRQVKVTQLSAILFVHLNWIVFGFFGPANIVFYNETKYFSGYFPFAAMGLGSLNLACANSLCVFH